MKLLAGDSGGAGLFARRREQAAISFTASGKRIELGEPSEVLKLKKRRKEWQNEAWAYYDTIGEIWFVAQFVANCMRRVRLYPAYVDPDHLDQPPVPIEVDMPADPDAQPGPRAPAMALQRRAVAEVDRLKSGDGLADIMFKIGLDVTIAGDCTLVGRVEQAEGVGAVERWKVYSNDQLRINTEGQMAIMADPEDKEGTTLDGTNDCAVRIWRSHPRWDVWADSPMKALLDTCDELSILSRMIRSQGRSRMPAGWLVIPSEVDLTSINPTADNSGGNSREASQFVADLIEALTTPIQDEGSASAVVPLISQMKGDWIEKIRHVTFARETDNLSIEQRKELIQRIANGFDIPAEILIGLTDLNHWTAWQIDEQTFKAHIEPLVLMICQALTTGFLWPALGGADAVGVQNIVFWYDPSRLVGHPNRAQDAKDTHDRFAINDAALRKATGFSEADAPSPEEIAEMMRRKATIRINDPTGYPQIQPNTVGYPNIYPETNAGNPIGQQVSASSPTANPAPLGTPATPGPPSAGSPAGQTRAPVPSLAASARRRAPRQLGLRLAQIDTRLRTQLLTSADAAVYRSVEMAGASLRRHAGRNKAITAAIDGVPNHLVASVIGEKRALAVAGNNDLLGGLDDLLGQRFDQMTAAAQARLREILAEIDPELDQQALAQQQEQDRRAGRALLIGGAIVLANKALFSGPFEAPARGEFDFGTVPAGLMRQALARAGGAPAAPDANGAVIGLDGDPVGGIATGTTALDVLRNSGLSISRYTWVTGAPERPFEPHADLDGETFSTFQDDILTNNDDWPDTPFFFPGDHLYCQCDFVPEFEYNEDTESPYGMDRRTDQEE